VSQLYPLGKQSLLEGQIAYLTDTIKVALVKNTYTPNFVTDQFYSDISSNVVGTPQTLTSKTSTNGVANAAGVTFPAVPAGGTVNAAVVYKDTGTAGTSRLIAYINSATGAPGLPFSPNGSNVDLAWDTGASKIFAL
jgi:hypothetical protein